MAWQKATALGEDFKRVKASFAADYRLAAAVRRFFASVKARADTFCLL